MQINISTRHGHLGQQTQENIVEKVGKLRRFNERLTGVDVTLDMEQRDSFAVEMRISAEHTHDFVANDVSSNVMAAVDGTIHKLEQQLRRHKEKVKGHKVTGLKHQDLPEDSEPDAE